MYPFLPDFNTSLGLYIFMWSSYVVTDSFSKRTKKCIYKPENTRNCQRPSRIADDFGKKRYYYYFLDQVGIIC